MPHLTPWFLVLARLLQGLCLVAAANAPAEQCFALGCDHQVESSSRTYVKALEGVSMLQISNVHERRAGARKEQHAVHAGGLRLKTAGGRDNAGSTQRREDEKPAGDKGSMGTTWPASASTNSTGDIATGSWMEDAFAKIRHTVVRISAVFEDVDWLEPYNRVSDYSGVGSGFVVDFDGSEDDPVFVSNAHVVSNAKQVTVELPSISFKKYQAYVPIICSTFDISVIRLKNPEELMADLRAADVTLQALTIEDKPLRAGMEVATVGFPLGTPSMKVSRGIISGTEEVWGNIVYQSTAPISPGNSGGPLIAWEQGAKDFMLVGINFASASGEGAQNLNFVVPTIHIIQVLDALAKDASLTEEDEAAADEHGDDFEEGGDGENVSSFAMAQRKNVTANAASGGHARSAEGTLPIRSGKWPHKELKVAPILEIGTETNEALYSSSGGCNRGMFLPVVHNFSALGNAVPPVPSQSFLVEIAGVPLDQFGMGVTDRYLGDPIPFSSLFLQQRTLDEEVVVGVCDGGTTTQHRVSMRWEPQYKLGVQYVEESHYAPEALDYEFFAGITVMQMTVNHFQMISDLPSSLRLRTAEDRVEPRIMITHIQQGTYASRVLAVGDIIETVNECDVSILKEFRDCFLPPAENTTWTLTTEDGTIFAAIFRDEVASQLADAETAVWNRFMLTPALAAATGIDE